MEIIPEETKYIEQLSQYEKKLIRCVNADDYGYLLLKVNPSRTENESQDLVVTSKGILLLKFYEGVHPEMLGVILSVCMPTYEKEFKAIWERLSQNKALLGEDNKCRVRFNYVLLFPDISKNDVHIDEAKMQSFAEEKCLWKEDFSTLKWDFVAKADEYIEREKRYCSSDPLEINDKNFNSILERLEPAYCLVRADKVVDKENVAGADGEKLIVTSGDRAVKAFRLDKEQINIVNLITKGEQLILACAGSGKSVLLIAKCFKAAEANPKKKFLITCYNYELQTLYRWFIDRAGFRERNVECKTIHSLCRDLVRKVTGKTPIYDGKQQDQIIRDAINLMNEGKISDRYYGIFIDEVQLLNKEWYKFLYNLLENKNSDDHIFVICGDKTQDIRNKQRHGEAPWNAGEGYPTYRGHKSIRIEKNYRNSIEINEYINRYSIEAKKILAAITDKALDPDLFLRGQSVSHGIGVKVLQPEKNNNFSEAKVIVQAIEDAYQSGIPYSEIAVITYNKEYKRKLPDWSSRYNIDISLTNELEKKKIPFLKFYSTEGMSRGNAGSRNGVTMTSIQSALGIDFRAIILAGLIPMGEYEKTKGLTLKDLKQLKKERDSTDNESRKTEIDKQFDDLEANINNLYVACTRAKDVLYIVQEEPVGTSLYIDLLLGAVGKQ